MSSEPLYVSVLLMKDGSLWVAQGLDYDLAAQGRTLEDAKEAFMKTFSMRVEADLRRHVDPLSGIAKAPKEYWDLFTAAAKRQQHMDAVRIDGSDATEREIPPAFMIPAIQQGHSTTT